MSEAVVLRGPTRVAWYLILVVASLLVPIVGGLAVILLSRLRRFRDRAPGLLVSIVVWLVVTAIQLIALFASFPISSSIENLTP